MRKAERWIRMAMYVSLIIGAWALTLCQISIFIENGHNAQMRNAVASCLEFDAPHALIVEGEVYCYKSFKGTESAISLDVLLMGRKK